MLIWTIIVIAAGYGASKAGAEVNVSAGVSVPFDTGPSSSPSYSSSNNAPSIPQASYQNVSSDSSSGVSQSFTVPNYSEQYQESFTIEQTESYNYSCYDDSFNIEGLNNPATTGSNNIFKDVLKGTQRFTGGFLSAQYKRLYEKQWDDLWSNAKYSRITPGLRNIKSGVEGVGLFMGGLSIIEPLSIFNKDNNFSGNHARALVAIRALRVSAVAVSVKGGQILGGAAGGFVSAYFSGGTASPYGIAAGTGVVGAMAGAAADLIFGAIEKRIMRWSGYEER